MKFLSQSLAGALLVLAAPTMSAFDTIKDSSDVYVVVWEPGTVSMQIKLPAPPGPLIDGSTSYAAPFLAAMQMWNDVLGVEQLQGEVLAPGTPPGNNGINEVVMDDTVDGEAFGENILAVTLSLRTGNVQTESDIIFNTAFTWDSYRGPVRNTPEDIRRVALHEIGHVLGLEHPDQATPPQTVTAIMNSHVSNVETLQPDDISGIQSLYGVPGFVPANNNLSNASVLAASGSSGQATGVNIAATAEAGEPPHAGETPTHSIWWRWEATSNASVTLTTFGSNFDTVMGVYTGTTVNGLTLVSSNDDEESGVIRSSKLSFTPTAGTNYAIVVDGWNGAYGQVSLALALGDPTGSPPAITSPPASQSVTSGGAVVFSVTVSGDPTGFQWFFNGSPISGATNSTFTLSNVTATNAGSYSVVATNTSGSATSSLATLTVLNAALSTQVVSTGHDVSLAAPSFSGTYQWQVSTNAGGSWTDLSNNATYSGVTTATLNISGASSALNNTRYRYVITNTGGSSTSAAIALTVSPSLIPFPVAIALDGAGNLFVGDSSIHTVHRITTANRVSTLAGSSGQAGAVDGTGTAARFNQPSAITSTTGGVLTVVDTANAQIRRVSATGVVTTLAGSATARGNVDGPGSSATFAMPLGIAQNAGGTFTIADGTNQTIRQMSATNDVTTLAGSAGSSGSTDGAGASARFNFPRGVAVDGAGNIYIADTTNNLIRRITAAGDVTTLAGVVGVSGWQDGTGSGALFNQPGGLATDSAGNIYVADTGNSVIRKITPAGVVTTLAGLSTIGGLKDGTGSEAWFNQPRDVAVDASGNVYVADTGNAAIRKITPAGAVTTLSLTIAPSASTGSGGGGTTAPPVIRISGGGGGGGGGGAPSLWFVGGVAFLMLWRASSRRAA